MEILDGIISEFPHQKDMVLSLIMKRIKGCLKLAKPA